MITFDSLIGKTILVGIKYVDEQGVILKTLQLHGIVVEANENDGIGFVISNTSKTFYLPPDLSAIKIAVEGEYRLKETGELVINPDFISSWTIETTATKISSYFQ